MTVAAEQDYHTETSHAHYRINDDIKHGTGIALIPGTNNTEQQEADMGNGRIGQHPFDISLRNGDEISSRHGQHGEDDEHALPVTIQWL